jgi:hypothetical protein
MVENLLPTLYENSDYCFCVDKIDGKFCVDKIDGKFFYVDIMWGIIAMSCDVLLGQYVSGS